MSNVQTTIAPHTQQACCVRTYPTEDQVEETIVKAAKAQSAWKDVPLKDRIAICHRFLEQMQAQKDEAARELTDQMGRSVAISCASSDRYLRYTRPLSQTPGELRGFHDRGLYLLSIAEEALKDVPLTESDKPGFRRYIRRIPFGVAFLIVPWK